MGEMASTRESTEGLIVGLLDGGSDLGLEETLRGLGAEVRRIVSAAAATTSAAEADLIVIAAAGMPEEEILAFVRESSAHHEVLVVVSDDELASKVVRLGAAVASGTSRDVMRAHVRQHLDLVALRHHVARLEATSQANAPRRADGAKAQAGMETLIAAAESLVPMFRFQRVYVDYALSRFGGNKVHTAAALGIDRRTIQRWARARAEAEQAAQLPTS